MTSQQRGVGFENFPAGTCGPVSELLGRLLFERTSIRGTYVCGSGHPALKPSTTHAWLEFNEFIVDLTHDQFADTGLSGWVFERSTWHGRFAGDVYPLCIDPSGWGEYPWTAYLAMRTALGR